MARCLVVHLVFMYCDKQERERDKETKPFKNITVLNPKCL